MINPGGKYVQFLQSQPSSNNGTTLGGLGHVLQQALLGYAMGQDQREEEAKRGRLTQALRAMMGTPENTITWNQPRPDGTGDPTTMIPGQAPNRNLAMQLLAQDSPELAFQMANQDYNFQRQQEASNAELMPVYDPTTGTMVYKPRGEAAGAMAEAPPGPGEPLVREFNEGGNIVTKQWNAATQTWDTLASAPRWQPQQVPNPSFQNFLNPATGETQAVDITSNPDLARQLASQGYIAIGTNVQSQTLGGLGAGMDAPRGPDGQPIAPKAGNYWKLRDGGDRTNPADWSQVPYEGTQPPPTVDQNSAAIFATMMQGADAVVSGLSNDVATSFWQNALSGAPMGLGNYAVTPEYQQYKQATDDFINAWLRRTSGAAISQSEYASAAQQFFPQPGDSPEVIAQKATSRQRALDGLISAAGGAYAPAPNTGGTDTVIDYDANGNRL